MKGECDGQKGRGEEAKKLGEEIGILKIAFADRHMTRPEHEHGSSIPINEAYMMFGQVEKLLKTGRFEEAGRKLAFIEGVLCGQGWLSADDISWLERELEVIFAARSDKKKLEPRAIERP